MHPDRTPDLSLADTPSINDIHAAARALERFAHETPILTSSSLDRIANGTIILKCENFQRAGAFKFRGAFNALSKINSPGVLTYSSGNHAQALALASALLGTQATIVMPSNAPKIKLRATQEYLNMGGVAGSRIVLYDPETQIREELGERLANEHGLTIIPPYDHRDVIAGQGTVALELCRHARNLDALFVPCGGGGLLSGSAIVTKTMLPDCRVVGVEPEAADDAKRSFETRTLHTVHNPPTIADGARTPHLGRHTFPIVLKHVDEIITVPDDALRHAMRLCFERLKIVVEPTGVLGLAGAIEHAKQAGPSRGRIGVIISGGNIDADSFSQIINP
ncbi:MAG TPA: pyridoxal-phosphate dependent enzyme [Phycisphaerales bacterium]|nr:pyridoxal-phosphate dependent enzyme [Phycisphaerales bacterium]